MPDFVLEQANQAAGIYEQLEQIIQTIEAISQSTTDVGAAQELQIVEAKLTAVLPLFNQDELLPLLASQLKAPLTQNKVQRMGLSKEVIRMSVQLRLTPKEISTSFEDKGIDIGPHAITTFLTAYENSTYAEKIKAKTSSIFDTPEQLERLLTIINTQLGRLSNAVDPKQQENHRGYVSELRQSLKLAADLQMSVHKQMEQARFQADIREILLNICTADQRDLVIKHLERYASTQTTVGSTYNQLPYALEK
jgi:hypothetical protein